MPGVVDDEGRANQVPEGEGYRENLGANGDHDMTPHGPEGNLGANSTGLLNSSIDQLYEKVFEMQSSDQSPSRNSFGTEGDESQIDSELRHLVEGEMKEIEIMEEEGNVLKHIDGYSRDKKACSSEIKLDNMHSASTSSPSLQSKKGHLPPECDINSMLSPVTKTPTRQFIDKNVRRPLAPGVSNKYVNSTIGSVKLLNGNDDLDNPDLGPYLLKQAQNLMSSGDNARKALDLAVRAAKSFEKHAGGNPSLDAVMCLHVIAALHCRLGQYTDAVSVLEHSIEIPVIQKGQDHALAKFAGFMQLGDTYAMLGLFENSISCYTNGLDLQRQVLGDNDVRVGETCRYLAEAHLQAMQFDEAQKLCQIALDVHKENGSPASLEEAADRRLMGLICEAKGDHESALEHLVLASMAMVANGQDTEVASVDCNIGDAYLSLSRFDEAIFSYQKALTSLKSSKGENHPAVASVFVRLAGLYNKTGKFRESRTYCENALRIFEKPIPGIAPEEIASGLTDISSIYESMDELDQALKLLQKALKIYNNAPGQQNTIAGIEAQMGVMYYMLGKYSESYASFKSATLKLRASGEKKSAFFGIALNQMGLACVQRYNINESVELFEEARNILELEYGPYHPDTLGVYSNLAGTYDAIGRVDDAIAILELIVGMREEKLGTANPDVDDEKRRLSELLTDVGKVRNRKNRSLEHLLDSNNQANPINNGGLIV